MTVVCGPDQKAGAGAFDIGVGHRLDALQTADTVVMPGLVDIGREPSRDVLEAIGAAWAHGARVAAICSGAFVLAATGLLDGRRATTHWMATGDFAKHSSKVLLEPDVLFVDEGRLFTSAGASAGLDSCLHIVRGDHGQAIAAAAARMAVAPLHREVRASPAN